MLILYQKHNEHLENDGCYYLEILYSSLSLSSSFSPERHHMQVLRKFLWHGFIVLLNFISPPSGINRGQSRSLPAEAFFSYVYSGQKGTSLHNDWEYIYFNICMEDMNVMQETLDVGLVSSILISYNVSHPDQDSFI